MTVKACELWTGCNVG